jgi:hypothetical protein
MLPVTQKRDTHFRGHSQPAHSKQHTLPVTQKGDTHFCGCSQPAHSRQHTLPVTQKSDTHFHGHAQPANKQAQGFSLPKVKQESSTEVAEKNMKNSVNRSNP